MLSCRDKPESEKPVAKATQEQPAVEKPAAKAVQQPTVEKPAAKAVQQPVAEKPAAKAVQESVAEKPAAKAVQEQPVVEKPVTKAVQEQPVVEKPVTKAVQEQIVAEKPAATVAKKKPSAEKTIAKATHEKSAVKKATAKTTQKKTKAEKPAAKIKFRKKYKNLTRKQRMQIRVRMAKHHNAKETILILIFVFFAFLVTSDVLQSSSGIAQGYEADEDSKLVVDFAGDVMMGRNVAIIAQSNGYDSIFSGVSDYWNNADLAAVNLESAVLARDAADYEEAEKNIHLYCDYTAIESMFDAGVNMLSLSNNHAFDYGSEAINELLDYLDNTEINYSGIGRNAEDAAKYSIIEVNGVKIAFISITEVFYEEGQATETTSGLLTTAYGDYGWQVHKASEEADITIVYMHWGEENEVHANDLQQKLGHQLIDQGADVIIGSHPHVVQEAERYNDGIIFYSLGNFIFDQGNTFSKDSMMVQMTVSENGECSFEVIPLRINNCTPTVASSIYANRINNKVVNYLDPSDYEINEAGHVVINAFTVDFSEDDEQKIETEKEKTFKTSSDIIQELLNGINSENTNNGEDTNAAAPVNTSQISTNNSTQAEVRAGNGNNN